MPTYRWNTPDAASAYDQAAPAIHPHYETVQEQVLRAIDGILHTGEGDHDIAMLVDLGGGSGRLVQRALERYEDIHAVLVDQSAAFLSIARRRLAHFAGRVVFVESRLQGDWAARMPASPSAIVSTSAIHHLDAEEKEALWKRCHACLRPGGVVVNGDEFRPADDAAYLEELRAWSRSMAESLSSGRIPASFASTIDGWRERNIDRFTAPRQSGDDCHETIAQQQEAMLSVGLEQTEVLWQESLWAVLRAEKGHVTTEELRSPQVVAKPRC